MYFFSDDFHRFALVALLVFPHPGLDAACNGNLLALDEVPADKLSGLAPGDDVNEIGLRLLTLTGEAAVDGKGKILIQRRSDSKPLMPGEWAATGGAAIAGEASRFAACRELKEELGIDKRRDELLYVTRMIRRNSLLDIYLTFTDCNPEELTLQQDEVAEVKWVSADELAEMVKNGEFHNYGKEYFDKLFAAFETKGKLITK